MKLVRKHFLDAMTALAGLSSLVAGVPSARAEEGEEAPKQEHKRKKPGLQRLIKKGEAAAEKGMHKRGPAHEAGARHHRGPAAERGAMHAVHRRGRPAAERGANAREAGAAAREAGAAARETGAAAREAGAAAKEQ
jgi:hypothetical protein